MIESYSINDKPLQSGWYLSFTYDDYYQTVTDLEPAYYDKDGDYWHDVDGENSKTTHWLVRNVPEWYEDIVHKMENPETYDCEGM